VPPLALAPGIDRERKHQEKLTRWIGHGRSPSATHPGSPPPPPPPPPRYSWRVPCTRSDRAPILRASSPPRGGRVMIISLSGSSLDAIIGGNRDPKEKHGGVDIHRLCVEVPEQWVLNRRSKVEVQSLSDVTRSARLDRVLNRRSLRARQHTFACGSEGSDDDRTGVGTTERRCMFIP